MSWTDTLPVIGQFLGGPAGGLFGAGVEWLAGKFGATDKTIDGIKQTLSNMNPDQLNQAKALDIDFQKFLLDNGIKLQLAQIDVNKEEAKSTSIFVAGWRPFVGWACGAALVYSAILEPMARFTTKVFFAYNGIFPTIDTSLTLQILLGMLGLAGMRSFEKVKDVANNH